MYIEMYMIAKLILTLGWKWQRRISKTAKLKGMKRDNDLKLKIRHILWFQKVIRFFCAPIVCCVKQFSNSSCGVHTEKKKSNENKLYAFVYYYMYVWNTNEGGLIFFSQQFSFWIANSNLSIHLSFANESTRQMAWKYCRWNVNGATNSRRLRRYFNDDSEWSTRFFLFSPALTVLISFS